jgi:hypothetical protein
MVSLDLLGVLDEAVTFPGHKGMLSRLSRIYLNESELVLMDSIQVEAVKRGRLDVVHAIDEAVKRTAIIDRWLRLRQLRSAALQLKERSPWLWKQLAPFRHLFTRILLKITNPGGRGVLDASD